MHVGQALADARAAYHRLMIGESVVEFKDQSGESVRYTVANADRLAGYIRNLEGALNGRPVNTINFKTSKGL